MKAQQASDLHEFGPAGTKFKKDVQVTFHTDKDNDQAAVYFTKENSEEFEQIPRARRSPVQAARVRTTSPAPITSVRVSSACRSPNSTAAFQALTAARIQTAARLMVPWKATQR